MVPNEGSDWYICIGPNSAWRVSTDASAHPSADRSSACISSCDARRSATAAAAVTPAAGTTTSGACACAITGNPPAIRQHGGLVLLARQSGRNRLGQARREILAGLGFRQRRCSSTCAALRPPAAGTRSSRASGIPSIAAYTSSRHPSRNPLTSVNRLFTPQRYSWAARRSIPFGPASAHHSCVRIPEDNGLREPRGQRI